MMDCSALEKEQEMTCIELLPYPSQAIWQMLRRQLHCKVP